MNSHELAEDVRQTEGMEGTATMDLSTSQWLELCEKLEEEPWVKFGVLGQRKKALNSDFDEETTKPASPEAQERLEQAYKRSTQVVGSIRASCVEVTKYVNQQAVSNVVVPAFAEPFSAIILSTLNSLVETSLLGRWFPREFLFGGAQNGH